MTGNNQGIVLQDRDRHLLRELAVMRVIDREQAKCVAGFGSTTRANSGFLRSPAPACSADFFSEPTAARRKALYSLRRKVPRLVEVPYRGPRGD